jgi:hypothetical protein
LIEALNQNAGAVTGLATVALLLVTAFYAWTTYQLLSETKQSRLSANRPRVVAYLRVNEVHSNIVQLHVANLSGSAATSVSALIEKTTEWPERFDLQDSKILRDLSFMRPHEVLKFDLGIGPDLFRDEAPAEFRMVIRFSSIDGRAFSFEAPLRVESVLGHAHWRVYGIDDVARRLKDIADALQGFSGFKRMRVETYDSADRAAERQALDERYGRNRQQDAPETRRARLWRLVRRLGRPGGKSGRANSQSKE